MRRSNAEQVAWDAGFEAGYTDGYVRGRLAGAQDARTEQRETPEPEARKGNGWVRITDELREQFADEIEPESTRAYIIRDLSGEILGVSAQE